MFQLKFSLKIWNNISIGEEGRGADPLGLLSGYALAQVVWRSLLVREVWDSNPELIKSFTCCQRLVTVATFAVWSLAQSRGNGHRLLVTPERSIKRV